MKTNLHIRERLTTVLFLVICVVIGIAVYFGVEVSGRRDELMFAYQHPTLVLSLKQKYASGSAELEKSMLKSEVSAQDKLINAVADQVAVSKE